MPRVKVARLPQTSPPRSNFREDLIRILLTDLGDLFRSAEQEPEPEQDTTRLAEDLIRDAVRERATDIHIDPQADGGRVRLRVDGRVIDAALLDDERLHRLVNQIKTLADVDPVKTFLPMDARFTYDLDERMLDIRVTVAPCVTGEKIAIRLLDPLRVTQSITDLGLRAVDEQQLKDWLSAVDGLFLVTGPTGSGKTTLLYSLLHELRQHARCVVTIEDPVEYQIDGVTQIQVDERHGLTFTEGLKSMLRLDPDYLMLGEIRDGESARIAVDASVGGRALMTTLHSRDAVSAISALRNWGLTDLELAVSTSVIVAQRLVRTLCTKCRQRGPVSDSDTRWLTRMGQEVPGETWLATGCDACRGLGFVGRIGVFETWRLDDSDYDLILAGVDERALRKHLANKGHETLLHDGMLKAEQGVTTFSELQSMGELLAPVS